MTFYQLPATLNQEIRELEALITAFGKGEISAAKLKAHRVPFGVYEQRQDNSYMMRIRCPGGGMTPKQLKRTAELAIQYGSGLLHLTTRQELQIHDLGLESVVGVMKALQEVGLSSRGGGGNTVRNIMASFDSGIREDEIFDVMPYVKALTTRLIAESDSWTLPRKFKISFSGAPLNNAHVHLNDLGFEARIRGGRQGFRVFVAGGMGSKPQLAHLLHDFIPGNQVYLVTQAVKNLFSRYGNRKNKHAARLRFLWNKLGRERFLTLYQREWEALAPESALLLDPAREEGGKRSGGEAATLPAVTPTSFQQEGSPAFALWKKRYVSQQKQPGRYAVLIPLQSGLLEGQAALELAELLSAWGEDLLRFTMRQNIQLRNIPEERLAAVHAHVTKAFPLASEPAFWGSCVTCAGADTCKLGICLPKGLLAAIRKRLAASDLDLDSLGELAINISGCSNGCGQHLAADIGFYGQARRQGQDLFPGYVLVAGAVHNTTQPALAEKMAGISARDLPDLLAGILKIYLRKKAQYQSFALYIRGQGERDLRALCEDYRQIPSFEEDKNYYFDWGARELFSLAGKGVGECSAGLFDLIDLDLDQADGLWNQYDPLAPGEEQQTVLYNTALALCRALLITRGVEAKTDAEVFTAFAEHFIRTGLVDQRFLAVVNQARQKQGLMELRGEIGALKDTVRQLYESMDDSLMFQPHNLPGAGHEPGPQESPTAAMEAGTEVSGFGETRGTGTSPEGTEVADTRGAGGTEEKALPEKSARVKDFRGVPCPLNFVKTKLELSKMSGGEALIIYLDDGEPIDNVPRSLVEEGHQVVEQKRIADYWSVLIRKKEE